MFGKSLCGNLIALLIISVSFAASGFSDDKTMVNGWEKVGDDDGILIYKKDIPGNPFVAFRGEGVIAQPMWRVFSAMSDIEHATEWVDSLVECRMVRAISPVEHIEYNHVGTPFIMKDRDFVIDVKVSGNKTTHELKVDFKSVEDPLQPPSRYVRGDLIDSSFTLRPVDDNHTWVGAEIHVDPKGSVPAWIVNMFQTGWPKNTIESARKQASKSGIKRDPTFDLVFKD